MPHLTILGADDAYFLPWGDAKGSSKSSYVDVWVADQSSLAGCYAEVLNLLLMFVRVHSKWASSKSNKSS